MLHALQKGASVDDDAVIALAHSYTSLIHLVHADA